MIKLYYRFRVNDSAGRIIKQSHLRLCHSFVIQFLQIFYTHADQITYSIKDTTGVLRSVANSANDLDVDASAGVITRGIVVGTGTNAPTNTDYQLQTIIAHGSGAGQLAYGGMGIGAPGVSGLNVDMILTRTFSNTSPGAITVRETGLFAIAGTSWYFCLIRDLLSPAQTVQPGQVLNLQYLIRTTV